MRVTVFLLANQFAEVGEDFIARHIVDALHPPVLPAEAVLTVHFHVQFPPLREGTPVRVEYALREGEAAGRTLRDFEMIAPVRFHPDLTARMKVSHGLKIPLTRHGVATLALLLDGVEAASHELLIVPPGG